MGGKENAWLAWSHRSPNADGQALRLLLELDLELGEAHCRLPRPGIESLRAQHLCPRRGTRACQLAWGQQRLVWKLRRTLPVYFTPSTVGSVLSQLEMSEPESL